MIPNGSSDTSQPPSTSTMWPSTQQPLGQASSNLFPSFTNQQQQQKSDGADQNTAEPKAFDMFSGINTPFTSTNNTSQPDQSPNAFASSTGASQTTLEPVAADNPFAASIAQFRKDTQAKAALSDGIQSSAGAADPVTPAPQIAPQNSLFKLDSMQTSPDNTPHKATASSSSPWKSILMPPRPTQTSTENANATTASSGNLFSAFSQPTSGATTSALFGASPLKDPLSKPQTLFATATHAPSSPFPDDEDGDEAIAKEDTTSSHHERSGSETQKTTLFGAYQSPIGSNQDASEQPAIGSNFQSTAKAPSVGLLSNEATPPSADNQQEFLRPQITSALRPVEEGLPDPPSWYAGEDQASIVKGWRYRALTAGLHRYVNEKADQVNIQHLEEFVKLKEEAIRNAGRGAIELVVPLKRSIHREDEDTSRSSKRQKQYEPKSRSHVDGFAKDVESSQTNGEPQGTPKSQTSNIFSSIVDANKASTSKKPQNPPAAGSTGISTGSSGLFLPAKTYVSHGLFGSSTSENPPPSSFQPQMTFSNQKSVEANIPSSTKAPGNSDTVTYPTIQDASFGKGSATPLKSTQDPMIAQFGGRTPGPSLINKTSSSNLMSPFGDASKKAEAGLKSKRKAEDFDSEEDNEADRERQNTEQQRLKKPRTQGDAKSATKLTPSRNANPSTDLIQSKTKTANKKKRSSDEFDYDTDSTAGSEDRESEEQKSKKPKTTSSSYSVLDGANPLLSGPSATNIFGHLAKNVSQSEDDDIDDAEDEDDEDDDEYGAEATEAPPASAQPAGRSLFDRVSKPVVASSQDDESSVNHTWKAESPIKFGNPAQSSAVPSIKLTEDTPSQTPTTTLFGALKPTSFTPVNSGVNLFGHLPQGKNLNSSAPSFGFGPAKAAHSLLNQSSTNTSRATSPGATTGESATESATEGPEDAAQSEPQTNFSSQGAGEEDEDALYEIRAKGLRKEDGDWRSKGVGPLRVLVNRKDQRRRVILRTDPSGSVVINSGFLKAAKYDHMGSNTATGLFTGPDGVVSPWHIRVKTNDQAAELAKIFNESQKLLP